MAKQELSEDRRYQFLKLGLVVLIAALFEIVVLQEVEHGIVMAFMMIAGYFNCFVMGEQHEVDKNLLLLWIFVAFVSAASGAVPLVGRVALVGGPASLAASDWGLLGTLVVSGVSLLTMATLAYQICDDSSLPGSNAPLTTGENQNTRSRPGLYDSMPNFGAINPGGYVPSQAELRAMSVGGQLNITPFTGQGHTVSSPDAC
ncbi:unnamed protein product [Amoebophrya sp. A120]|nr:unnamed protein product [Amoebophrya sp. A120]|eukprot:GSA120T00020856001.1